MAQPKIFSALEANKLPNEMCKEVCGHPVEIIIEITIADHLVY